MRILFIIIFIFLPLQIFASDLFVVFVDLTPCNLEKQCMFNTMYSVIEDEKLDENLSIYMLTKRFKNKLVKSDSTVGELLKRKEEIRERIFKGGKKK